MNIVCLDLEGVLVPEIWIAFAQASGIPELKRTTRDEPDYNKLMQWRLGILREHGLGLRQIVLQHARGCSGWNDYRIQNADSGFQAEYSQGASVHRL